MWANAQRDGRPAKYRWRPLFNAAKFGWRPLLECRAVTLWGHLKEILLLNNFFRLSIRAQMATFRRLFCVLHFQRDACTTFQTCIS